MRAYPMLLVGIGCALLYFISRPFAEAYRTFSSFDGLEAKLRESVPPQDLQRWAVDLLSHSATNRVYLSTELETNAMPTLFAVAPRLGPRISTHQGVGGEYPSFVRISWGNEYLGSIGFEVGPTNLTSLKGTQWHPGVYFYSTRLRW